MDTIQNTAAETALQDGIYKLSELWEREEDIEVKKNIEDLKVMN